MAFTSGIIGSLSGAVIQEAVIGSSGAITLNNIVGSEDATIWYLRDEKADEIIISGSLVSGVLPNNCQIINQGF